MTTDGLAKRMRRRLSRTSTPASVHQEHLLPISSGISSFEEIGGPGPEPTWRMADPHQPALFERNPTHLKQDLMALWQNEGREALTPLAEPLAQLADQARNEPLHSDTQISSTTYALQ